jgi:hypothetical protein
MYIVFILWFVCMLYILILLSIDNIKDWYNSTPSYVRQIDLK